MRNYKIIINLWNILFIYLATKKFIHQKRTIYKILLNIICSSILLTFISFCKIHFIQYLLRILTILFFLIIEYRKNIKTLFSTLYIIYVIEFIFEFLLLYTLKILQIEHSSFILLYLFSNFLTLIFNHVFKDYLLNLINTKEENKKFLFFKYLANFLVISLIVYIQISQNTSLIINNQSLYFFFTLIIFNLSLSLYIEKNKEDDYFKNYSNIVEYSTYTEGLLSEYKSLLHEHKNKLIIIKGLAKDENKELHDYLNMIINEKISNNYYWLTDIKNIPIQGIKGLINYKLLKMKELKINIEVYVSEELSTIKNDQLNNKEKNNLYTILGVILDNAIEAALESKEKIIGLQLFKEENEMHIILANTFNSINLEDLGEKGYSSKGKNRGYGLYLVNEILKQSPMIQKETRIINNFFVQKIIIKI